MLLDQAYTVQILVDSMTVRVECPPTQLDWTNTQPSRMIDVLTLYSPMIVEDLSAYIVPVKLAVSGTETKITSIVLIFMHHISTNSTLAISLTHTNITIKN